MYTYIYNILCIFHFISIWNVCAEYSFLFQSINKDVWTGQHVTLIPSVQWSDTSFKLDPRAFITITVSRSVWFQQISLYFFFQQIKIGALLNTNESFILILNRKQTSWPSPDNSIHWISSSWSFIIDSSTFAFKTLGHYRHPGSYCFLNGHWYSRHLEITVLVNYKDSLHN